MTTIDYHNKRIQIIEEFALSLSESDIVALHNAYCERNSADCMIYDNSEWTFNELMHGKSPYEVAQELGQSSYCIGDDYFTIGAYGLVSFSDPFGPDSPLYLPDILGKYDMDELTMMFRDADIDYSALECDLDDLEAEWHKSEFQEEWDKLCQTEIPTIQYPNGARLYIHYNEEEDTLETGSAVGIGFCCKGYPIIIDVDYEENLDWNLAELDARIIEKYPELIDEPNKTK